MEKLYKVKEVASMFGVSPKTIRRWIKDGRLLATRLNSRNIRVAESDIMGMVAAGKDRGRE